MSAVEIAVLMYGVPVDPASEFGARLLGCFLGGVKRLDSDPDWPLIELLASESNSNENGVCIAIHGYYEKPNFFIGIRNTKVESALGYPSRIYKDHIEHIDESEHDCYLYKFLEKYDLQKEIKFEDEVGWYMFPFVL